MLCGGLTQNEFYFLRIDEAIAISVSGSAVHLWCQSEEGSVFLEADVADSYNYHKSHPETRNDCYLYWTDKKSGEIE